MSGPCNEAFDRLAGEVGGFSCDTVSPIVDLHNPFGLTNWTLAVVELLIVTGAVLALVHAVRRWRRGDRVPMALVLGSVLYLLIIEPPLYFPDELGVADQLGLVFAHNEFTVQFLYGRLPLYIVALYPAMLVLAYELVRVIGVFARSGAVVDAVTVGFVHGCLYEVFDHLGPQLRWWIWNPDAPSNSPQLASVPMSSLVLFGSVSVIGMTLVARLVLARRSEPSTPARGGRFVLAVIGIGIAAPLAMTIGGMPSSVFGMDDSANDTGRAIGFAVVLVAIAVVGSYGLITTWTSPPPSVPAGDRNRYVTIHGGLYLAVMALLWITALPDALGAVDGTTDTGTPVGSLPYALASFAVSGAVVWAATVRARAGGADAPETSPAAEPDDQRSPR